MKMKKIFDSSRKHTLVVGNSGSGLSRCIPPEIVNEIVKDFIEKSKEYRNGKNQGK